MLTLVCALLTAGPQGLVLNGEPFRDVPSGFVFELPGAHVQVTVTAGDSLRLQDLAQFASPGPDGVGLIDWTTGKNVEGTKLSFSRPLSFFSLEAGDWFSDDDGPLSLVAYDCDGRELSRDAAKWGAEKGPPFAKLSVKGQGICSVRYRSGGGYAGSTFITAFRGE